MDEEKNSVRCAETDIAVARDIPSDLPGAQVRRRCSSTGSGWAGVVAYQTGEEFAPTMVGPMDQVKPLAGFRGLAQGFLGLRPVAGAGEGVGQVLVLGGQQEASVTVSRHGVQEGLLGVDGLVQQGARLGQLPAAEPDRAQ